MTSFYTPLEHNQYESTQFTAGPWGPDTQHAGPPSALLAKTFEELDPRPSSRLARVSIDILSPIPVAPLSVQATTILSRKNVELLEGTVSADEHVVLRGRAWRFSKTAKELPRVSVPKSIAPLPEPSQIELPGAYMDGYMSAIEWRFANGGFFQRKPSSAWLRPRMPLLPEEELTPWQRTLIVADSGSGVHMPLDPRKTPTVNCDLVVSLDRDPVGEWIGMEAETSIIPEGGGTTNVRISDESGVAGTSSQVLFIRSRL
ncbi:thioesterase family protein [Corynebacterium sp.]|uniref:thioesterase family protein n=1 Tax=Corynebacterium sp. TaxID=1720 RepID=UPI0037BF0F68